MFSSSQDNPFFENPSSSSFLISFPTCLLNDEELLFDHLLHHQSPPLSVDATAVVPSSDKPAGDPILAAANPNSMDKDQGLGRHVIIAAEKKAKGKPQAEPPAVGKRKRVGGVKKQLGGGGAAPSARRRTGKKDRHSKIYTAQGPRDRRMRLSLQIARKFFDLQDMLGFDKASKTIEWLFAKSKAAIRELTASLPPHQRKGSLMLSSASLSSTSTTTVRIHKDDEKSDFGDVEGNNDQPKSSKSSCSNPTAKESREKARARARQRTMEKNKQKELMLERNPNNNSTNNTNNASKLGSSSTPESVDQEDDSGGYPSNQELNPTLEAIAFNSSQPQKSPVSIIEKLLGSDSSASSSSIYDECNYMGFAGNWVTDSLRMYPSYGAITGVDELQVILQQQNPKCVSSSPTGSSGMNSHQHCSISRGRNLL